MNSPSTERFMLQKRKEQNSAWNLSLIFLGSFFKMLSEEECHLFPFLVRFLEKEARVENFPLFVNICRHLVVNT